ncbi:MAG TPA: DM13 domain-containing protein, partial [Actinomycetota bacterium]|nr:DM13 domain-containing protein [Actinomycetota bacterium]
MLRRIRTFVGKHPRGSLALGLAAAVGLVGGIAWFEPHKLFIDETVSETIPVAPSPASPTGPPALTPASPSPSQTGPVTLADGRFRRLEHAMRGTAELLELPDGTRILRLSGFETSNGPDLRVYLSEVPASDDWYAYGERFIDLGDLKGNIGDQNYPVPEGADLSEIRSAVIWCRRFEVGFGVA